MKKIKIKTVIQGKEYLLQYSYQNYLYPTFIFEAFHCKIFGIKKKLKLEECGHLNPCECIDWDLERFKEHGITVINKSLNLDSDTKISIENFNKVASKSC